MTTYHFQDQRYTTFADLCKAYHKVKGYYPAKAYSRKNTCAGWHLYYK